MELREFTYIFLILCIPFFQYIVHSTYPKKGFSFLFIILISTSIFLSTSFFSIVGIFFLLAYLYFQNTNYKQYLIFFSFTFFLYELTTFDNFFWIEIIPALLPSAVFSLMMIGHWFLVDPTIKRNGMKNIALFSTFLAFLLCLLVMVNFYETNESFFNFGISSSLKLVITLLYASASLLSFGSYKSLNEKSYTGVMASTGLSYLSLIVSLSATGTLILSS